MFGASTTNNWGQVQGLSHEHSFEVDFEAHSYFSKLDPLGVFMVHWLWIQSLGNNGKHLVQC